jgi:PhoPQ-activated pathogenicity-related protein
MMLRLTRRHVAAIFLFAALPLAAADTALDRYVRKPDPTYKYELLKTIPGPGYTAYVIDLTSQTWRTPADVDRTVWKHWLTIVKPDQVTGTTGYMFITGGSITSAAPTNPGAMFVQTALATHTVTAELRGIPNEPVQFADETRKRTEDEMIAYTWRKFLLTGDETWPLRLPMTKASVRAMDTIQAFMAGAERGSVKVEKFVVSGGSKRGWTTWTTAAVDPRVTAIIPASIDTLNVGANFKHHWKVYGFWSPQVKDYDDIGLMDWLDTPEYNKLMAIEDPYSYRDRLTLPKYMVQAAGDQYFLPDASRYYFDDLKGEKYLRYIPNADHGLRNTDAEESLVAFYQTVTGATPRPRFTWSFEKNGDIRIVSQDKPTAVKLWQATNPDARDFRLVTLGPKFTSTDVAESSTKGVWIGRVAKPEKGFTAFFVEMTYPGPGKYPMKFTSGVRVSPDTEPFPDYVAKPHPKPEWPTAAVR